MRQPVRPPVKADRRRTMLALSVITLAGATIRLTTITIQSFGLDETFTVWLSRKNFGPMLAAMSHTEGTPPAYYVAAWCWGHLFGTGEVGLRSLSALLGAAAIPLAGILATSIAGRRAGIAAAALVAANPLL